MYTAVAPTPGAGPEHHEAAVGLDLLADEDGPLDVFGDTTYSTGDARCSLDDLGHRLFLKPASLRPATLGGFTLDDFAIDTTAALVTCIARHTVPLSASGGWPDQRNASFKDLCTACLLRERCTKAKARRVVTIRPHHDLQAAARHHIATRGHPASVRQPLNKIFISLLGGDSLRHGRLAPEQGFQAVPLLGGEWGRLGGQFLGVAPNGGDLRRGQRHQATFWSAMPQSAEESCRNMLPALY
ncbi:transposase [Streptomyces sp. NPDC002143]